MIAALSFIAFPLFSIFIYRRHSPALATCIVVLAGSLLLPERYVVAPPLFPDLDKERITYLSALLSIVIFCRDQFFAARPGLGLEALLILVLIARVGTLAINSEPVFNDGAMQPGIGLYWLVSYAIDDFLIYFLPFLIGRSMIHSKSDLRILLLCLAGAGCIYTILIVVEVLLSVPFHVWQFSQTIYGIPMRPMWRWGIIQPVVFMDNGLAVASFMAVAVVSAAALWSSSIALPAGYPTRAWRILLVGLTMTWNVAGIVYGWVISLAYRVFSAANLRRAAVLAALLVCIYPMLRIIDIFPTDSLVEFARGFDSDRARSLEGRFLEEDFVLGTIDNRFWFGWGMFDRIPGANSFGRGETGLDSWWIIRTGLTGIVGVELLFWLLAIPILRGGRWVRKVDPGFAALVIGLMLCVALRMADLLLNGWFNSLPAFLAGSLIGVIGKKASSSE